MCVWVCVINLPAVNLQPSIHTFRAATVAHGRLTAARVCVCVCLFWRWRSACCSVQHLNHLVSVATTLEKCACVWQGERGWWVRSSVSDSFSVTTMETIAHKHPWVCLCWRTAWRGKLLVCVCVRVVECVCVCVVGCVVVCVQIQQMLGDLLIIPQRVRQLQREQKQKVYFSHTDYMWRQQI